MIFCETATHELKKHQNNVHTVQEKPDNVHKASCDQEKPYDVHIDQKRVKGELKRCDDQEKPYDVHIDQERVTANFLIISGNLKGSKSNLKG